MGIKINQNIFSMLVQRNLDRATKTYDESMERLSSGERINCSADDPSGLASSEQIRYEIKGLQQNQQNVSGAFSLLGTAESQLSTMVDSLQRIRQLTVQAGNETLSASDRQSIQAEIGELIDEVNRTATSAKMYDQNLLDGSMQNVTVQVGTRSTDTLSLSLSDFRTNVLGSFAQLTSDNPVSLSALTDGQVQINGFGVPASTSDGLSTSNAAASSVAKAAAINSIESKTSVHAEALPTAYTGSGSVHAVTLDGSAKSLIINGINIGPVYVQDGDDSGALVDAINEATAQTGVTASLDSSGKLKLNAQDGRNISVKTTGSVADELGLAASDGDVDTVTAGQIKLTSTRSFTVIDSTGTLGMTVASQQVDADASTALGSVSVADMDSTARALLSIDAALSQISDARSRLGAISNRLESLTDTLARRVEDLSSADSSIRDTDYAYESARLTQSQILQQAGIAMLSQANVSQKSALQLLQDLS